MPKKHAVKKQAAKVKPSGRQINGRSPSTSRSDPKNGSAVNSAFYDALVSSLSKVKEIEAVFAATDEDGICHVYSVVDEHS
ncbi:MAG: hypothetical protein ACJ8FY_09125, partial [Gemmataceae bacterium]